MRSHSLAQETSLFFFLLLSGCARQDVVAELPIIGADAGSPPDGSSEDGGGLSCEGRGPPLITGDSGETCGSAVAERTFHFAVCSCTDLVTSTTLTADAFDSREGPYTLGQGGGSIGTNGGININADLVAGGSLWAAGVNGITAGQGADMQIGVDLHQAGPLAASARVTVGRDARVGGRVAAAELSIGGTLTLPDGAPIDVPGMSTIGTVTRAPVAVGAPCSCDESVLLDVAAYVARHETDNDNASAGLTSNALANVDTPKTIELPCGRWYFDRISAHAKLTINVTGRAIVFAGGDLALEEGFEVTIGDGAELDLFVAGNVVSAGTIQFGSSRTPARARLYAGGNGTLQLSGDGVFAGNLYAPRAELVASAPLEVFGSIFVRRMAASASVIVHYDTAVLRAGDDCEAPPVTSCTSCGDCPNVACTQGQCAACTVNADCCPPLFCVSGRCEAAPF